MTTFDFPYKMIKVACPACSAPRKVVDGRSLRSAREVKGVPLRALARLIGRSAAYLSDVERNQRTVTPTILLAYKRWLA